MTDFTRPVPGFWSGATAVLVRDLLVWRKYFLTSLVGILAEPTLYLFALGWGLGSMVSGLEGMSYIEFIAPGLVVAASMYGATFECTYGTYTRMVPQHTFTGILSTPVEVSQIVTGEILFGTVKAVLAGCGVLLVAALFGLLPSPLAMLVPLVVVLSGVFFAGLSVLVTSLSPSYDFFNYYFTLLLTPLFLFSGVFFPLSQLPAWAQHAAWISPLTHATELARALCMGTLHAGLWWDLIWMLVAAALPWIPATRRMKKRLIN